MKTNIIILTLIFLLSSCGFTPIYQNNIKANFSIEQVTYTGDRELNNFLKSNLNQYKNEKIENKIYIEANSIFKRIVLSKDKVGEVTNYQLETEVIFLIKPSNKKIKISEKKIMESKEDKFEEARYERTIKQNFASSISNKLVSELIIN
jgi:type III secretory pathway component EscR